MASPFSRPVVLYEGEPRIVVCAALLSHPPNTPILVARSEAFLREHRVGLSLNVAADVSIQPHHRALFARLDVTVCELPIDDSLLDAPPRDFLERVVLCVERLRRRGLAVLLNCAAGMNRSAFAAGAVMWACVPKPRPWPTPQYMIADMRARQSAQRGMPMLTNYMFEHALVDFCHAVEGTPVYSDDDDEFSG